MQELRQYGAGVAPGAVQSTVGRHLGGDADFPGLDAPETGRGCLERRRQIGARVGVAHREHIDLVQPLLSTSDGQSTASQHARERRAVERTERVIHAHSLPHRNGRTDPVA